MITRTIMGGDALTAWSVLGSVSRVDDAEMDGILEARTALEKAFGYDKRKAWPFPQIGEGARKTWDLDAADKTTVSVIFEAETLECVLRGLLSLAERTKKDGETSGMASQVVAEITGVAATFGVRNALRKRLRSRGAKVPALAEPLDSDDVTLQVDVPDGSAAG